MAAFDSVMQFLPIVVLWIIAGIPAWKVVGKSGFNPAWSLLALVPVVNLVALWVFALKPWPALRQ